MPTELEVFVWFAKKKNTFVEGLLSWLLDLKPNRKLKEKREK